MRVLYHQTLALARCLGHKCLGKRANAGVYATRGVGKTTFSTPSRRPPSQMQVGKPLIHNGLHFNSWFTIHRTEFKSVTVYILTKIRQRPVSRLQSGQQGWIVGLEADNFLNGALARPIASASKN